MAEMVKTKRGECEKATGSDLVAISEMVVNSMRNNGGRPAVYPDTQQGLEAFRQKSLEFFEYIENVNRQGETQKAIIPDIELWAGYMGVTRVTIHSYQTTRGQEWKETIESIKNYICAFKKQLALNFKVPPALAIFDLCNNHHYANTNQFSVQVEAVQTKQQQEQLQLETEIANSGLRWNETTGEYEEV